MFGNVSRSVSMGEMPTLSKKPAFVFLEQHGKEHLANKVVPMPADELFLRLKRKTQKWRVKKSGVIEGLQKKNPCPMYVTSIMSTREHSVLPTEIDGWLLTLRSPSEIKTKLKYEFVIIVVWHTIRLHSSIRTLIIGETSSRKLLKKDRSLRSL